VREGDKERAAAICLDSYQQTGNLRDLGWASKAFMYLGELEQAERLANQLLGGPVRGDGYGVLAYIAMRRGNAAAARSYASAAFAAHRDVGDEHGMANDAASLSDAEWRRGDFAAALDAADEALRLAEKLHEPRLEVSALLARAEALRELGDTADASESLKAAIERATDPCDKTWARFRNGRCLASAGQNSLAMLELTMAQHANRSCGDQDISAAISLNQGWLLRWKDPAGALASVNEALKSAPDDVEALVLRGYLAAGRHAFAEANRDLAQAMALEPPDADWRWQLVSASAELSEQQGPLGDMLAEYQYLQAAAMVATLRMTALSRSAYFVSSHRGPSDGLIALRARTGRWYDALTAILDLDASDMLRATAMEVRRHDFAPADVRVSPSTPAAALPASTDAVLSAWKARDLVIVIAASPREIGIGQERTYRIQVVDGKITGEDVGNAAQARQWAGDLFADPGNREAARALGTMMIPQSSSDRTLYVLAIGFLGKVPLAALRTDDGSLIVAKRPLVRVLALRTDHKASRGTGPPVVIADPRGDLPGAAKEGNEAAAAIGPGVQVLGGHVREAATRAQLWAARDAELLHIAGHVGTRGRWRALQLQDGDVDSVEIVRQQIAPRLAVLAGCGSAAATDTEGWGSIAAALLDGGTSVVIATDRSVNDSAARALMINFYQQPDWRTDPAHALAQVQTAMDAESAKSNEEVTKPRLWAAFSVMGRPPADGEEGR
jgi:tetratricopeptide (TPR) repeat protein